MKLFFRIILALLLLALIFSCIPEIVHKNNGTSISHGKVQDGYLENGYLLPYKGKNFYYFSFISYYLMNNAYTNSKVHATVLDAYKILEKSHPKHKFRIMECSDKNGGKLAIHNTHRNGLSIDFMSPKKGKGLQFNSIGMLHYLLEFDKDGKLNTNKKCQIDFELMAQHILALHNEGKKHGIRIKKVILKINLKDNLFSTTTGKILQQKGIYFAKSLPKRIDDVHDDHYHIDFEII